MKKLLALSVFVFSLDQLLKAFMLRLLYEPETIPVVPGFFSLTLVFNRGAAFGIFHGRIYLLVGFAVVASVAVLFLMHDALRAGRKLQAFCFAALLGAVCGNIADRVRLGAVVDFLDFYVGSYCWPSFNLADTVICVTVALLCFDFVFMSDKRKNS